MKEKNAQNRKRECLLYHSLCKHDVISDSLVVFRIFGRVPRFPVRPDFYVYRFL